MSGKTFTIILIYLFVAIYSINITKENERTIMNIYYSKDNYVIKKSKSIDKSANAYAIYDKSF